MPEETSLLKNARTVLFDRKMHRGTKLIRPNESAQGRPIPTTSSLSTLCKYF